MFNDPRRLYSPEEVGRDGYPGVWHVVVKHLVREEAGHRCVRCGHPYPPGIAESHPRGEFTPCDAECVHFGPGRHRPNDVDYRANSHAFDAGQPLVIDEDGWVYFDSGDFARMLELGMEGVEAKWRILTVHHLNGVKWDLRWWNLVPLCQRCHLIIQGKVRLEQTYPFEHSEWFKPYAAGYYGFVYLDKDLTREETEDRLEELLALELQTGGTR